MQRHVTMSLLCFAVLALSSENARGADVSQFEDFSKADLPGRLFIPPPSDSPQPLILFLHGAGETGDDNTAQVGGNINNLFDAAQERGVFLYAPQAVTYGWADTARTDAVMDMVDQAIGQHNIDTDRLYVTGLSMGGGGTWNVLARNLDRFAAAVPIAAVSPDFDFSPREVAGKPIWAFHARDDGVVSANTTRNVVNRLNSANGDPAVQFPETGTFKYENEAIDLQYTEWGTGGHGIWGRVYDTVEMYDWMFAQALSGTTLDPIVLNGSGATYQQSFDDLGTNGTTTGIDLPIAWTHGRYGTKTTKSFPVAESVPTYAVFNAGGDGSADRTLALGVANSSDDHFLQFATQVAETDASSVQLQFAIEAWDSRDGIFVPLINRHLATPDDPGEAAFNVAIEIDRGNGFEILQDFGTITTGPVLAPISESVRDGNAELNRITFDSGPIDAAIPVGSEIRVRWHTATDAQTEGWVFGLDDVVFSLSQAAGVAGDFNNDGILDVADLDVLTEQIRSGSIDTTFDLDGNGEVSEADRATWVTDLKRISFGDANLDGKVDRADLNVLGVNWQSTTAQSWSDGDFNGDGKVNAPDLNFVGANWQNGDDTAAAAVPEPTHRLPLLLCLVMAIVGQRDMFA